jgi:hypothetical protein
VAKHTIYSFQDEDGRTHTVKVPGEASRWAQVGRSIRRFILMLFGGGFIYLIGYLMGISAGGY